MLFSPQELCKKLHDQINISEEERYSIEFKLNLVMTEVRHFSFHKPLPLVTRTKFKMYLWNEGG